MHESGIDEYYLVVTSGASGSASCLSWCCSGCIYSVLNLVLVQVGIFQGNRVHLVIQALVLDTNSHSR